MDEWEREQLIRAKTCEFMRQEPHITASEAQAEAEKHVDYWYGDGDGL